MVSVMGMIFFLSHQPGDFAYLPPIAGLDKVLHVFAYSILAGSFLYGLQPFSRSFNHLIIGAMAVIFCIVYGIGDEYHQSFIPGRFASFWDVMADGLGGLLAAGIWMRREGKKDEVNVK